MVTVRFVPVALVKERPVEEDSVVAIMVAAWKLLLPVALVKEIPVEETVVRINVVPVAFTKKRLVDEAVVTVRLVPVALVKKRPSSVDDGLRSCVDDTVPVRTWKSCVDVVQVRLPSPAKLELDPLN